MTWLENHHALITLFALAMVVTMAVVGVISAHGNPLAIAGIIGPGVGAVTGIHAGTSAVAANPNTAAYGTSQLPSPPTPTQTGGTHP